MTVIITNVRNIGWASSVYFLADGLLYCASQARSSGADWQQGEVARLYRVTGNPNGYNDSKSVSMKSERAQRVVAALVAAQAKHLEVIS